MAHLVRADVEAKACAVAIVMGAPVQDTTAVGTFPVVELRIGRTIGRWTRGQEGRGALGIRTTGEILHPARREQQRERQRLSGDIGDLRREKGQAALAREFARRPHQPRVRVVIEDPRQHVGEQRLPADPAALDRLHERVARLGRAILQKREHLQRALGREVKIAMRQRPGERGIEILAVALERALLEVGVSHVGVNRGEPVHRPPFRGSEPQAPARGAIASDFHVELKIRRLRERHPHLAAQRGTLGCRQQSRCPDERAVPVGHARAGGGRVQTRDRNAHEILAALGLLKERGGTGFDDGLLWLAQSRRHPSGDRRDIAQERATIRTQHDSYNLAMLDCVGPLCTFRRLPDLYLNRSSHEAHRIGRGGRRHGCRRVQEGGQQRGHAIRHDENDGRLDEDGTRRRHYENGRGYIEDARRHDASHNDASPDPDPPTVSDESLL